MIDLSEISVTLPDEMSTRNSRSPSSLGSTAVRPFGGRGNEEAATTTARITATVPPTIVVAARRRARESVRSGAGA
jgi:hypothetical protein